MAIIFKTRKQFLEIELNKCQCLKTNGFIAFSRNVSCQLIQSLLIQINEKVLPKKVSLIRKNEIYVKLHPPNAHCHSIAIKRLHFRQLTNSVLYLELQHLDLFQTWSNITAKGT